MNRDEALAYMRDYMRRRNAERRAAGLCVACGRRSKKSYRCPACAAKHRQVCLAYNRRRAEENRAAGKCPLCGGRRAPGFLHCPKHLVQLRAASKKYRDSHGLI